MPSALCYMKLIICPGIHPTHLTNSFVEGLSLASDRQKRILIFPAEKYPAYSAMDIYRWLETFELSPHTAPALFFISFSAGVVGGIGAAVAWHLQGGKIAAFVAIDGWGVPLVADFPIYRLSHDYFTYWSSALLGKGRESFYAEPSVEHLTMWRSPELCWGWQIIGSGLKIRRTAAEYLQTLILRYERQ